MHFNEGGTDSLERAVNNYQTTRRYIPADFP